MPIERIAQTYNVSVTAASKSALIEVMTILRSYREALVLVGGWVPYFLLEESRCPGGRFDHVGSIDIDLAIDPEKLGESQYATIVELLRQRGYGSASDRLGHPIPNSFQRTIESPIDKKPYSIQIDFLTHEKDPRQGKHRNLPIQNELLARKTKGCEAALRHKMTLKLTGVLPSGGEISMPIQMADVTGCLAMKGIVLGERYQEKDAYDIYTVISTYKGGPRIVADAIAPYLPEPLVMDAIVSIQEAFATRKANGPQWVADFLQPVSSGERERLVTDAFMMIQEFMRSLPPSPPILTLRKLSK